MFISLVVNIESHGAFINREQNLTKFAFLKLYTIFLQLELAGGGGGGHSTNSVMVGSRNAIHHFYITNKTVAVGEHQIKDVSTISGFSTNCSRPLSNEISQSSSAKGADESTILVVQST